MWRVITSTCVAFAFSSTIATAQQPCTTDAGRVVAEIYRHSLERGVDPGAQRWEQALANGSMTVRDVVRAVAKSPEYMDRFGSREFAEGQPYTRAVARLYRHVLGRQPDANGQAHWAGVAQQNGLANVVDGFVNSAEYSNNFGDWGVPGSGGLRFCANGGAGSTQSSRIFNGRFRGMDRNGDGVISRTEWQGNTATFNDQDWNNDGVLSGDEVRQGARRSNRQASGVDFDALDVNGDNRIARREWDGRLDEFYERDVNNDNFLSRAELRGNRSAFGVGTAGSTIAVGGDRTSVDTGIDVRAGETVTISAEGQIRLSRNARDFATAAGSTTGRRAVNAPLPNAPAGALIGRIGDSNPVVLGERRTFRAPRSGRLYLGINDDYFDDNTGQYNVMIDVE